MRALANIFLKGFFFVLPFFITFSLLYWVFASAEAILKPILIGFLPENSYRTGMGVVSAAILIFCVGLLVQNFITKFIFQFFVDLIERIPLVKTIYHSISDLVDFFAGDKNDMNRVVLVTFMDDFRLMGFVTNEKIRFNTDEVLLAVYFPMSYQVGGYTAYLPQSRCEALDIPVKTAMQQVLTANVQQQHKHKRP